MLEKAMLKIIHSFGTRFAFGGVAADLTANEPNYVSYQTKHRRNRRQIPTGNFAGEQSWLRVKKSSESTSARQTR
jgi:hypothetical protein